MDNEHKIAEQIKKIIESCEYECISDRGTTDDTIDYSEVALAIERWLLERDTERKCASCGEVLSQDCPTCKRLWES